MIFTVFTPTFNRAKSLKRLYDSLLDQTMKDFEWLIVDDGSTDNTEQLVNVFASESKISISYIKQDNGGKHRAINKGLDFAQGELFFIVDSDDYLPSDSLEITLRHYESIKKRRDIAGVVGFRAFPNGSFIGGKKFPINVIDSNLIERRSIYKVTADMAKVIKTDIFRKYRFPDIQGEKFVAESIIWNRIAKEYKFRYFNEAIYFGEYLEGGLSNNSIKNRRKNPLYATLLYAELANNPHANFKLKLKAITNFWRFAMCRKTDSLFSLLQQVKNYPIAIFVLPIGLMLYLKDCYINEIKLQDINKHSI